MTLEVKKKTKTTHIFLGNLRITPRHGMFYSFLFARLLFSLFAWWQDDAMLFTVFISFKNSSNEFFFFLLLLLNHIHVLHIFFAVSLYCFGSFPSFYLRKRKWLFLLFFAETNWFSSSFFSLQSLLFLVCPQDCLPQEGPRQKAEPKQGCPPLVQIENWQQNQVSSIILFLF